MPKTRVKKKVGTFTSIAVDPAGPPQDTPAGWQKLEARVFETERLAKLGYWEWDEVEDRCIYCSPELARLHGYSVEDFLRVANSSDAILEMIHPKDRAFYDAAILEARQDCCGYEVEYRLLHPSGPPLEVREVADVVLDKDGRLLHSFGYMQDISEQKNVAEAFRVSEESLRQAQRQARIGNWRWDVTKNRLISCSEEYARIHGVSHEEAAALLSKQMESVVHPEDRRRVEAEFKRYDDEGIDYEIEYRIVRPDGEVRYVTEIGETFLDSEGNAVEQTGTIQDTTERHYIEDELRRTQQELEDRVRRRTAQLRESETRYRKIFDTAAAGIGRASLADGRILLSNLRLAQMFGYEGVDEFVKDYNFAERALDPSDYKRLMTSYYTDPGKAVACDFLTKDNTPIVIQAHAIPNQSEGVLEFVVTDITAQRATEARLRQAQKMEAVGQLTGGVAHDFNNLLAVIMGNIELLQLRMDGAEDELDAVYRAAKRGADLTQHLLAFSRQQPLAPQVIDVAALVSNTYDLLGRTLGETVEIKIEMAPGLWNALADPGQVENALLNLALNARDAMPGGGQLTISCSNAVVSANARITNSREEEPDIKPGNYVMLAVEDTGHGMSSQVRSRALDPFFTTKEVGQGSGLGLSMVYGFAKQSGGQVTIESTEGCGTTVRLYLPRPKHKKPRPRQAPATEIAKGHGEHILVIEDNPGVADMAVAMLLDLNYHARHVQTFEAARKALDARNEVSLLLCDVVLPGRKSGVEVAAALRQDHPRLKLVFMSGRLIDSAGNSPALDLGAPFLAKPFRRHELAKILNETLHPAKTDS